MLLACFLSSVSKCTYPRAPFSGTAAKSPPPHTSFARSCYPACSHLTEAANLISKSGRGRRPFMFKESASAFRGVTVSLRKEAHNVGMVLRCKVLIQGSTVDKEELG
jgi:hypothetical protein